MKKHKEYLIQGKKVPSVTTILDVLSKPGLEFWYGKLGFTEANKQKEEAAKFGTAIHNAIEDTYTGQVPSITDERMKTVISNFTKWSDRYIDSWLAFEKAVFHDELHYAGTADAFAILKGSKKMVLIDFKTSKKVRDQYFLQVTAYAKATRIEDNAVDLSKIEGALILHLNHETLDWEVVTVQITPELFEVFKCCLEIYKWKNQTG